MARARHEMPPEIVALSLDEIAECYIGRFRDKKGDWEAFEDAKIDGYRRALALTTDCTPPTSLASRDWISPVLVLVKKASDSVSRWE